MTSSIIWPAKASPPEDTPDRGGKGSPRGDRTPLVILGLWLAWASPARALPTLVPLASVPPPGAWAINVKAQELPMSLTVIGGQTFSDNPPSTAVTLLQAIPVIRYGLPGDGELELSLPASSAQRADGAQGQGLGDLTVGVGKGLISEDRTVGIRAALVATFPTGAASVSVGPPTGIGTPAFGFDLAARQVLVTDPLSGPRLLGWGSLQYRYPLRQPQYQPDGSVNEFWHGQWAAASLAGEYFLYQRLSFLLEGQFAWQAQQETNMAPNPGTGSITFLLAPGASYRLTRKLTLTASVLIPAWRGGNQPSYVAGYVVSAFGGLDSWSIF